MKRTKGKDRESDHAAQGSTGLGWAGEGKHDMT